MDVTLANEASVDTHAHVGAVLAADRALVRTWVRPRLRLRPRFWECGGSSYRRGAPRLGLGLRLGL